MSRRLKDKRSRRFYGVLADPWRKLISVGLAILLWYWLHAQITKGHEEAVELLYNDSASTNHVEVILNTTEYGLKQFVNGDSGVPISEVTLQLEGPNSLIAGLEKPGQMAFKVTLSRSDVDEGTQRRPPSITFGPEVLHHKHDPEYDRRITKMTPRTVRIELRKNDTKKLPLLAKNVKIDIVGGDPAVEARLTEPKFFPNPVEIYGAEEQLADIGADTKLFTASLDPRQIDTKTEIILPLRLATEFARRGLSVTPPNVIYKIEPRRVTYELKNVPVILDRSRVSAEEGAKFEIAPKFVDFKIRVAAQSKLDAELNEHYSVGLPVSTVPPFWTLEHALFRVVLRPEDLTSSTTIERKPSIRLFKLNQYDQETTFQPGPDYLPAGDLPIIKIERRRE